MTEREIDDKMLAMSLKKADINERIVKAARAVLPVLKDAGRAHSAAELDVLFFELDAHEQERLEFCTAHPDMILASLLRRIAGARG